MAAPIFDGQPHYADVLRVAFEPLSAPASGPDRARMAEDAAGMLHTVLALEEYAAPRARDEEGEYAHEFQRLERKLDLVLELLAQRADGPAPAPVRVQVASCGARWACEGEAPLPGTPGVLSIQLHRMLPRRLRLAAEVVGDGPGWLQVRFVDPGEVCEELLRRHVFLQHRRGLAEARRTRRVA